MASPLSADIPEEPRRPPKMKPRRKSTIDSTILSPGAVRINYQGAFIVDEEPSTSASSVEDGVQQHQNHATQGIRLPNHKAVVSHVALDASAFFFLPSLLIDSALRPWWFIDRARTDDRCREHRLEGLWPNWSISRRSRTRHKWAAG